MSTAELHGIFDALAGARRVREPIAMTDLKTTFLQGLADAIKAAVPQLAGVGVGQADQPDQAPAPTWLRAILGPLKIEIFVDDPVPKNKQPDNPQLQVVDVGSLTGTVTLQLSAQYPAVRAQLEAAILAFLIGADDMARGVVYVTAHNVTLAHGATLYEPRAAFYLTDDQWNDERVWSNDRRSEITLDVDMPIVVDRVIPGLREELHLVFGLAHARTGRDSSGDLLVGADGALSKP